MKPFLKLTGCQPRIHGLEFKHPVNWELYPGQTWAIVGDNGAGKSVLADMIRGKYALKSGKIIYSFLEGSDKGVWQAVQMLSFDSVYGVADFRNAYYQQRWHSSENDDMPSVMDIIGEIADSKAIDLFDISGLLEKKVNFLSSGELRKFLITRTLIQKPDLLIIDNPYIGLDIKSREILNSALRELCRMKGIHIIFIFSSTEHIPDFVTHILPVEKMEAKSTLTYKEFIASGQKAVLEEYPLKITSGESTNAVALLNNITIKYGGKIVLSGIDWNIHKGEKWVLLGQNGSGKSTLLSLINADHPQAYSNDITIFGKKRGVGQSIWEIKKHIGYISPEMHTHYYQNISAIDVVGSGFYDTIGTVNRCSPEQEAKSLKWMQRMGISHLRDKSFMKLSSGEQRLVLLARTFVKEPEMLILDEPLHGLDDRNKQLVREIIDDYVEKNNTTLIYVSHYMNELPRAINRRKDL